MIQIQARYLAVLFVLGAVWGASFLFIKIGVVELTPVMLVAVRLLIAALLLLGVLYARGLRLPTRPRIWFDFLLMGTVGLIAPYILVTWGTKNIASGMAAILNGATPLFSVLVAYAWLREERMSGLRLLGLLVGFCGMVVAVGIQDFQASSATTQGQLAILLATLCYAVTGLYARRAFHGLPALVPATGQLITGALVIIPIALALHGMPTATPSLSVVGAVLALAIFCTAFAYVLLYWLIEHIGATRTSMVTYLLPPFALLYGALFLHEAVSLNALTGLGLVIGGILLSNK